MCFGRSRWILSTCVEKWFWNARSYLNSILWLSGKVNIIIDPVKYGKCIVHSHSLRHNNSAFCFLITLIFWTFKKWNAFNFKLVKIAHSSHTIISWDLILVTFKRTRESNCNKYIVAQISYVCLEKVWNVCWGVTGLTGVNMAKKEFQTILACWWGTWV